MAEHVIKGYTKLPIEVRKKEPKKYHARIEAACTPKEYRERYGLTSLSKLSYSKQDLVVRLQVTDTSYNAERTVPLLIPYNRKSTVLEDFDVRKPNSLEEAVVYLVVRDGISVSFEKSEDYRKGEDVDKDVKGRTEAFSPKGVWSRRRHLNGRPRQGKVGAPAYLRIRLSDGTELDLSRKAMEGYVEAIGLGSWDHKYASKLVELVDRAVSSTSKVDAERIRDYNIDGIRVRIVLDLVQEIESAEKKKPARKRTRQRGFSLTKLLEATDMPRHLDPHKDD